MSVALKRNANKENTEENTMSVADKHTSSEESCFCLMCVESFSKKHHLKEIVAI